MFGCSQPTQIHLFLATHSEDRSRFGPSTAGWDSSIADHASIVMLALWSVLLWEHKIGLIALEQAGADRFNLVRELDRLLREKQSELPDVRDGPHTIEINDRGAVVIDTGRPYDGWDSDALLEPLLRQAEHEAKELGHNYIGSEHLVLAIVELADPALTALLQQHGVWMAPSAQKTSSVRHPQELANRPETTSRPPRERNDRVPT